MASPSKADKKYKIFNYIFLHEPVNSELWLAFLNFLWIFSLQPHLSFQSITCTKNSVMPADF